MCIGFLFFLRISRCGFSFRLFRSFPVLIGILIITSCRKEEAIPAEQLPPVSSTGANTFGMVVNGKIVTARGAEQFTGGLFGQFERDSSGNIWYPPDSSDLFLRIRHKDFPPTSLFVTNPRHISEWELNESTMAYFENMAAKAYVEVDDKRSGITTEGIIRSGFRCRSDWVFSAEFSFHCINPKTCQEFSVKDGRIDVNLRDIKPY